MSAKLSDFVLANGTEAWEAMQQHRFVTDIVADALPDAVFHRYLVYEGAFVATAMRIFSYAVIKAPDIDGQRWLIGVLDALANHQIAYFEQTFARLGVELSEIAPDARVEAFDSGMLTIAAEGKYIDIIAAMFAAEWMYWHWCTRAAQHRISNPVLKEWVDLHAAPEFEAQARWLKAELDRCGAGLPEVEMGRVSALFNRVVQLEIDFHSAAYAQ